MCTYGLEQWAQSQSVWVWQRQSLTNFATAGLVAFGLVARFLQGRRLFAGLGREYLLLLALSALMLASLTWNYAPAEAAAEFARSGPYFFIFAILMPLAVEDLRDLRAMLLTMVLLGGALSLLLLTTSDWRGREVQFATGSVSATLGITRGNPLAIGSLGAAVCIAALLMGFRDGRRLRRAAFFAIAFFGFAVAVKSGSRGQTLAILVAAAIFFPLSRRVRNVGGFLALGLTLVLCVAVGIYVFDALTIDANARRDARWGLDSSLDAVQGGRLRPAGILLSQWAAAGPFRWVFGFGSNASWGLPGLYFYPHMVPAEVLGELGLLGFALFALLNIWCVRDLRAAWPIVRDDPEARGLLCAIGGLWVASLLVSCKEGSLIGATDLLGFAAILGRVTASVRREARLAAEADAAGYAMTDEERLLEDEARLDELYQPAG